MTKTISLADDAYEAFAAVKREGESLSLLVRRRLEGLVQVPFGPRAALRFGAMLHDLDRAGVRIGAMDGMIAASALVEGAVVATRNTAEFTRVPGLQIATP